MSIFEKLQAAGLPVISASENGEISMGEMTEEQRALFIDILLEHFLPIEWTETLDQRATLQILRDNYITAIARLQQIQSATNPTNAQVIQAIRDMAQIQERTLKFLKRFLY